MLFMTSLIDLELDKPRHHREAKSSISTLTSAVTDLLTTEKFNIPTPCKCIFFFLWPTKLLCYITAALQNTIFFLHGWQLRDAQHHQNPAL